MKISDGLLHKQIHFVLNSHKTFTFYWIRNLKGGNANIAKKVFLLNSTYCQSLVRYRRGNAADRFTSGRVQVLSKKWKYCRYKQRFIHTSTLSNKIAWWSSLNKITRARFFETPRSYETPSKPFFTSQHGLKFSPRNGREISSITRNEFKTKLDFSFNIQSGF